MSARKPCDACAVKDAHIAQLTGIIETLAGSRAKGVAAVSRPALPDPDLVGRQRAEVAAVEEQIDQLATVLATEFNLPKDKAQAELAALRQTALATFQEPPSL